MLSEYFKKLMPFSKVKISLLLSFLFLMIYQVLTGFNFFEDYFLAFIFILFLNDQFLKIKQPEKICLLEHEKKKRFMMTILILLLLATPSFLDFFHVSQKNQYFLYKLGFIIWAQVFLVDAFYHFKETNSKKWLLFANAAMFLIVFGAFVIE
jgi:hypothetical protein